MRIAARSNSIGPWALVRRREPGVPSGLGNSLLSSRDTKELTKRFSGVSGVSGVREVVAMPPPGGCARGGGQWAGTHGPPMDRGGNLPRVAWTESVTALGLLLCGSGGLWTASSFVPCM